MEYKIDNLITCNMNSEICWLKVVEVLRYENQTIDAVNASMIELENNVVSSTIKIILKQHGVINNTSFMSITKSMITEFLQALKAYYLAEKNALIDAEIGKLNDKINALEANKI